MKTLRDLEQEKKVGQPPKRLNQPREGDETLETASESLSTRALIKLELFQNGFFLDDEPFRDYKQPSSREILSTIKKGRVPPHLREKYPHDDILIDFKDRRTEKWKTPSFTAFSGTGSAISKDQKLPPSQFIKEERLQELEKEKKEGSTKVKVVLASGKSVTLELDPEESASQLIKMVEEVAPTGGAFELVYGFPLKRVEDSSRSLRELGLLNCVTTQKML